MPVREMVKSYYIKFCPVIGFGYWKEVYKFPFQGHTHNIIAPFLRIQFGALSAAPIADKSKQELKVV